MGTQLMARTFAFIKAMQECSVSILDELHRGIGDFKVVDFPDHDNVGDSAIYLGQLAYWHRSGRRPLAVFSKNTVAASSLRGVDVLIHGGGNFGGLYPEHSALRYGLAGQLDPSQLLIQLPQSVVFVSGQDRQDYLSSLGARATARVAVRDQASAESLAGSAGQVLLAPDSVHALGHVDAPAATQEIVWLKRQDKESAGGPEQLGADWPALGLPERLSARLRVRGAGPLAPARFNKSPEAWAQQAHTRFQRGVEQLSVGETIITDRLHAMLMGLQMGRRVIAVDNSVQKLSRYLGTWFGDLDAPVELVESFDEARRAARRTV